MLTRRLVSKYCQAVTRLSEKSLAKGLLFSSLLGLLVGMLVRSLVLLIAFVREASGQGYGLTHIVLGIATGYGLLHETQRKAALELAAFFTSYELGEWPLGDPPFQELRGYATGIAIGVLVALLYIIIHGNRLYSSKKR